MYPVLNIKKNKNKTIPRCYHQKKLYYLFDAVSWLLIIWCFQVFTDIYQSLLHICHLFWIVLLSWSKYTEYIVHDVKLLCTLNRQVKIFLRNAVYVSTKIRHTWNAGKVIFQSLSSVQCIVPVSCQLYFWFMSRDKFRMKMLGPEIKKSDKNARIFTSI